MKKSAIYLLLAVLFMLYMDANGQVDFTCQMQDSCSYDFIESGVCTPDQNGCWAFYRNMNTYIPFLDPAYPLQNPTIMTIQVNINIIQKNDSSGNFPNNQTTIDRMTSIIGYVNSFYSSYSPSDPINWVTELPNYDSRIRFSIGEPGNERIYFYQNTFAWNDTYPSETIEPYIQQNHPERLKQINVYIFGNPNNNNWAHANLPSISDFNRDSWVVLFYWDTAEQDWAISGTLAHEFGHSFGLLHTYIGGGASVICDQQNENFLRDLFLTELPNTSNCPHICNWPANPFITNGDGITNNLLGGNQHSTYISPMQAGQMHRSMALSSVRKYATCEKSPIPLTVEDDQNWDFNLKLYRDLIINPGAHLNISCKLVMHPDGKIIVKPDGKLTIDGGVITNDMHEKILWQGIEVWGDPEATQTDANQGVLEIYNNGTIENAVVAVRVGSKDIPDLGGGIVHTNEAIFRNNRSGVIYHDYAGNNLGNFNLTTFETTEVLADSSLPAEFMRLLGVEGVSINGCTFRNTRDKSVPYNQRGTGILSYDASYNVDHLCISSSIPCTQFQETVFDSLYYGVKAYGVSSLLAPSIKNTGFTNNFRGVYTSGITYALVKNCSFLINAPFATDGGYGLYLDNSTAYTIAENNFYSSMTSPTGIGVIVHNSGGAPNEIYRNWFTNLHQGISAQEQNREPRSFLGQGLQILCCEYDNCNFDILVPQPAVVNRGIALHQGANAQNAIDMAGNLFDIHSQIPNDDFDDINNQGAHFIYYYPSTYETGFENVIPVDYTQSTVTIVGKHFLPPWTFTAGCPPTFSGGGGSQSAMSESLMETQQMIDSAEQVYALLVDGGNTENLYEEVYGSTSAQTMVVYNELMGKSPYLSDTVVGAAIEKEDVIPGAMLRDIMVANPHTAKSDNLMGKLDSRYDPLPEYMKAQILAGRSLVSLKEEMESNLARYNLHKAKLMNGLIHHYMKADISDGSDSVINLLQTDGALASKYRLAIKHLEMGNTHQVLSVINALPTQYNLQGQQLATHQQMADFCNLTIQMASQEGGWQQATGAQVSQLHTLLQSETPVAAYARNVLLALNELSYTEPILVPNLHKSAQAETSHKELMKSTAPPMLEVNPNPAKDFVIVSWLFDREQASGNIAIRPLTGGLMTSFNFSTPVDKQTIDTGEWPSGAYIVTLYLDGKVKESAKFTIVK